VSPGYVDQVAAFQHRGRTIEACVERPKPSADERRHPPRARAFWVATVDNVRHHLFPVSPDDSEEEIRSRIRRWLDENLS